MKNLLQLLLLLSSFSFYAQQKYHFDRAIIVKSSFDTNDSVVTVTTNSLANSKNIYFTSTIKFTKDSTSVYFLDINGIQVIKANFEPMGFKKSESFTVDCKLVGNFSNYNHYKAKEYDFVTYKDTVFDGKNCYHIVLQSNKSLKYQKRKRLASCHLIIEKNADEIPFLHFGGPLLINTWEKNNLPIKGRTLFSYYKKMDGKISRTYRFEYGDINRYLLIPEACDYVKNRPKIKTLKSL